MNTKLIATLGVVLTLTGGAMAYGPASREVISPGTFFHPVTGGAGLATCELITAPGVATFCGTGGFGAFFTNIGCSNDDLPPATPTLLRGNGVPDNVATCLDDIDGVTAGCVATDTGNDCDGLDDVATGTCTVSTNTATIAAPTHAFFFLCGTDRDDDIIVTDGDASSSTDDTGNGASLDDHDDDFVTGDYTGPGPGAASANYCFARDRTAAGNDWDDIVVFVGVNFGNTGASLGSLTVSLTATGGNVCPTVRSSHTNDGLGNDHDWVG